MPNAIRTLGRARYCAVLCTMVILPGCFSLSRGTPTQQHFILGAADVEGSPRETALSNSVVVGFRLPRLANYLASPFVVLRRGTHRIEFSDFDRWGEDLALGINRTLSGQMAILAPGSRFASAPWPVGATPDQIVQVDVLRFEGVAPDSETATEGEAHLLANWEIFRAADNVLLARGTTEVRTPGWPVGDFGELVGLLDAGIGTLAEEILSGLEALQRIEQATTPP